MYFILFILFITGQRLLELYISSRNKKWLLSQGAIEYGKNHYPYMVALHTLFISSLIAEYWLKNAPPVNYIFLVLYVLLLLSKVWVVSALGRYWNIRIYRVTGASPIKKGPYKLFRHPNYFIVVCEVAIIPLVFNLYYTAIIFTVLNAVMLSVRIKVENKVWAK